MREAYPFRGVWRWLLMPACLAAAGALHAALGGLFPRSILLGAAEGGVLGLALALGRPPWTAAGLAALGSLGYYAVGRSLGVGLDTYPRAFALAAATFAAWALAHHAYLRLRKLGLGGILSAALVYEIAALWPTALEFAGYPDVDWMGIAVDESKKALLQGIAMAFAARVSERAAPAPTPPAQGR